MILNDFCYKYTFWGLLFKFGLNYCTFSTPWTAFSMLKM